MKTGLRFFIYLAVIPALLLFIFFGTYHANAASDASAVKSKNKLNTSKNFRKTAKKNVKKTKNTVTEPAVNTAKVIDITNEQKKNLAASKETKQIYDLGNIVVHGEDKTKIKDKSKKKTAYLTADSNQSHSAKKDTADFNPLPASIVQGKNTVSTTKAFIEGGAGSDSMSEAAGMIIYERASPADNLRTRSILGARGEKSGGYRYKSDYSALNVNYKYESEKNNDTCVYGELSYDKSDRNLPGFDNFENNFINVESGIIKFDARYLDNAKRFSAGLKKAARDFRVHPAAIRNNYDSSIFSFGYSQDIIYDRDEFSLPLTLEFNFQNDSLDIKDAKSSSASSTRFGANAEKALNENTMIQIAPQIYKNGENNAKGGGTVSLIFKDKNNAAGKNGVKYSLTAGRQALKYDTADFLFSDSESVIYALDAAGANRFDGKTYENDEKFIQLSATADLNEDTNVQASFKNARSNGLLYLTDLNRRDARFTFNSFADNAKINKFGLKISHKLDRGLILNASMENIGITDSINDLMPYIPENEYVFGVDYKHKNGLFTKFTYKIKGAMDSSKNPAINTKTDRYTTAGIYMDKNFSDNGKIYFKADNIFNNDLKIRPGYSYKSRTFSMGVNYIY